MGAAEDIYERLNTEDDIRAILDEAETLHLDFKQWNRENYLEKVGEALSGFANADGGVLVFGVEDKPRKLHPFKDPGTVERTIHGRMKGLVHRDVPKATAKSIFTKGDAATGYVVLLVPASDEAPHRAAHNREYYRRSGDGFHKMDHYEIADVFGRRHNPKLLLDVRLRVVQQQDENGPYYQIYATFGLANVGRAIARFPAVDLLDHKPFKKISLSRSGLPERARLDGQWGSFSGGADDVVHAGGMLEVTRVLCELRAPPIRNHELGAHFRARIVADRLLPHEQFINLLNDEIADAIEGALVVRKGTVIDD